MTNMSTHRVQSGAMPTIYGSSFSVEDSGDTAINVAYTNTSALFLFRTCIGAPFKKRD